MPTDKAALHQAIDDMGPYGSLTFTGTGAGYSMVERRILKVTEMTVEQRRALAAVIQVFGTCSLRVISSPDKAGHLAADRVEMAFLRRG